MERLSTGLRINSAKDDAAGLAITSKMTSLSTLAKDFKDVEGVLKYSATSSSESVFTVTSDGTASPGSYSLNVTQLATAEKDRSVAFSGGDIRHVNPPVLLQ